MKSDAPRTRPTTPAKHLVLAQSVLLGAWLAACGAPTQTGPVTAGADRCTGERPTPFSPCSPEGRVCSRQYDAQDEGWTCRCMEHSDGSVLWNCEMHSAAGPLVSDEACAASRPAPRASCANYSSVCQRAPAETPGWYCDCGVGPSLRPEWLCETLVATAPSGPCTPNEPSVRVAGGGPPVICSCSTANGSAPTWHCGMQLPG